MRDKTASKHHKAAPEALRGVAFPPHGLVTGACAHCSHHLLSYWTWLRLPRREWRRQHLAKASMNPNSARKRVTGRPVMESCHVR